jgi:biopolymer transport protein ExbD
LKLKQLRSHQRRKRIGVTLDIINLIDVMLVLLIFFMATTSFISIHDSIQLKLPQSSIISKVKAKKIIVSVDASKKIYINEQNVSIEEFDATLKKVMKKDNSSTVMIKGDKALSYGYLVHVMSLTKLAGATQIDIATTLNSKDV